MQPYLNPIANFDAKNDYQFTYLYLGSSRVLKNEVKIREAKDGSDPIYSRISTKFDKSHIVPKGSLENGKTYWASIRVEVDGEFTEWSPDVSFLCLATPSLKFDSLDNENYIFNDDIMMQVIYRQEQGERIETFQFTLLDQNKQAITKYPVRIPDTTTPNVLQERMTNLVKGRLYYVGVRLRTKNGINHYEDHEFIPQFITPALEGIVVAEAQPENGQVLVQSYLKQLLGTQVKPSVPGMDVANDVAYSYWKDEWIIIPKEKPLMYTRLGMAKASDWVAKVWCENIPNGVMLDFAKEDNGHPHIKFIKHDDYITCEKELGGIKSRTKSNTIKNLKLGKFYLYIKVIEYRVQMTIVPYEVDEI